MAKSREDYVPESTATLISEGGERTQAPADVIDLGSRKRASDGGITEPPPTSRGFAARIDGASIADLVQLECMRGMTRAVRVSSGGRSGYLYFDEGQVVHAQLDHLRGEPAAIEVLSWVSGTFEPSERYWVDAPTIRTSWQGLLLNAATRADEEQRPDYEEIEVELLATPTDSGSKGQAPRKAHQEVKQGAAGSEPGILRAVRIDGTGQLLASVGEVDSLVDVAAYSVRLAELIGEALGIDGFQGLETTGSGSVLLAFEEQGTMVFLEATEEANLSTYRKMAGTSGNR